MRQKGKKNPTEMEKMETVIKMSCYLHLLYSPPHNYGSDEFQTKQTQTAGS